MTHYDEMMARIEAVREHYRREYEWLASRTGQNIAEIDLDLTQPDPGLDEEELQRIAGEVAREQLYGSGDDPLPFEADGL